MRDRIRACIWCLFALMNRKFHVKEICFDGSLASISLDTKRVAMDHRLDISTSQKSPNDIPLQKLKLTNVYLLCLVVFFVTTNCLLTAVIRVLCLI